MSDTVSIKKNYIYNLSYQILTMLAPLITTPYISRVLGVENIGVYSYTTSIVAYFTLLLVLGLHIYGQREVAYAYNDIEKQSRIFFEVQGFKLISFIICSILYFGFVLIFCENRIIMLAQYINILAVFFDVTWYFAGKEQFKVMVLRNFIIKILGTVLIFVLIKSENDLLKYILFLNLLSLTGNVIVCFPLRKEIKRVKFSDIKIFRNTKTILELFIPLVAIQIYNVLDKTMIGIISSDMVENGYYEQTTKLITICLAVITSFVTVLAPRMATEFSKGSFESIKEKLHSAYCFIGMLIFPMCIGLILISDDFVPFFFGAGYEKVALLIKIYALVLMIIPLSNIAGYAILVPAKQHNKGTFATIIGATVNFCLNMILIPRMFSVGAAIATVIAEFIVTAMHFVFVRKYINIFKLVRIYIKYLFSALCMGLFVILTKHIFIILRIILPISIFAQISVGIIIYLLIVTFVFRDKQMVEAIMKLSAKFRKGM